MASEERSVLEGIDHVGIAVTDLESAVAAYTQLCGAEPSHRERLDDDGVEVVMFDVGPSRIELLGATGSMSKIANFIRTRGPGLHHVAYATDDIDSTLGKVRAAGLRLIDEEPRTGIRNSRVAFLHPRSTGGVLTEIVEPAH